MAHFTRQIQYWILFLGWVVWCPSVATAQGWQRFYGGPGNERAFALQLMPDGSMLGVGSAFPDDNKSNVFYFTTDSIGQGASTYTFGDTTFDYFASVVLQRHDGKWLLFGGQYDPFAAPAGYHTYPIAAVLNASMAVDTVYQYDFQTYSNDVIYFDNGFLLLGAQYISGIDSPRPRFFYQKLDAFGQISWSGTHEFGYSDEATTALVLANGQVVVAGNTTSNDINIVLKKINPDGQAVQAAELSQAGIQTVQKIFSTNGHLLLVGRDDAFISIQAISEDFSPLWSRKIGLPAQYDVHSALLTPGGDLVITGAYWQQGATNRDAFITQTDTLGNMHWFRTYGGTKGDILWDIKGAPDGNGFLLAGQTASFSPDGNLQAWLMRTDSTGEVWHNQVVGRVHRDEIENCVDDPSEPALRNWLVTASGTSGSFYTLTDTIGTYSMALDTGEWFISVLPPSGYWSPCEDSLQVVLFPTSDTIALDIPVQASYQCPLLDVDLSTPFLRRCFENTYSVRYFNYGTAAAPNAQIFIELDPYFTLLSSSLPYVWVGDSLLFSVGEVPALEGGSFAFSVLLDCDSTVLGQTHCAEAHIYPDSLCFDLSPEWDGAHVEVDGICMGDSVLLTITNTGQAMQGSVNFIITEDQIIFKLSTLQLAAGQDTSFVVYPGGSTVTIIVDQTAGHPGNSQPMIVIEGCGGFPFSTGFAFQFPQNDGDFSTDIECRQSIGSYDPNDKMGIPEGVGDEHIIAPETAIEYLIRFQNTGTDTAFRVEIRDTISLSLDLATFRTGASSHPYQLSISGQGVLSFLFDPIILPDSGANWVASQGYIKYKIAPKNGLALGTQIENQAAIYFDQNTPIWTAKTRHTIGNPFEHLTTSANTPKQANISTGALIISPNPTTGNTLVHFKQPHKRAGLQWRVMDALGRVVMKKNAPLETDTDTLDLSHFPSGIYVVALVAREGTWLASARIIKL